jgi:hypothetical protein
MVPWRAAVVAALLAALGYLMGGHRETLEATVWGPPHVQRGETWCMRVLPWETCWHVWPDSGCCRAKSGWALLNIIALCLTLPALFSLTGLTGAFISGASTRLWTRYSAVNSA